MTKLKISLVSVGSLRYPVDFLRLAKWESAIFSIHHAASICHIPNAAGANWDYTTEQLAEIVHRDVESDITVALISAPLEDNYYMRRLGNNVAVLSFHEMAEIIRIAHFTLEDFILRNLYELVTLYVANNKKVPESAYSWAHDDVRGCLFDMNSSKEDILFSMHPPKVCHACKDRLLQLQIDREFLPALDRELPRITLALFYRMQLWVKEHPILSLLIASVTSIALNIIASILFEIGKALFSGHGLQDIGLG